jgi:ligand-binding SRPBCC domain-containing protein
MRRSGVAFHEFEVTSVVPASPERVWERVSTMEGVNHELMPLARMTHPRHFTRLDPSAARPGQRLFRSWILFLGVVPVDYDDLTLVRVEPGRGFLESSPLLSQRRWIHQRTLEAVGGGCRVTDRIRFEPRLPVGGRALVTLFRLVFRHRHRRLGRFFRAEERWQTR